MKAIVFVSGHRVGDCEVELPHEPAPGDVVVVALIPEHPKPEEPAMFATARLETA